MTQKNSLPFGLNSEDIDELTQLLPSYPTHKVVININSTHNNTGYWACGVCGIASDAIYRNIERIERNPSNGKPFNPVLRNVCEHCFLANDTEMLVNEMQKMTLGEQIIDAFNGCFTIAGGSSGRKGTVLSRLRTDWICYLRYWRCYRECC